MLIASATEVLLELQTWCSADCCNCAAFQLSEAAIKRWLIGERIDRTHELAEEIAKVESRLTQTESRIELAVRGLESEWDKAAFQTFWEKFRQVFTSAVIGATK